MLSRPNINLAGGDHAVHFADQVLHAPEAAPGQGARSVVVISIHLLIEVFHEFSIALVNKPIGWNKPQCSGIDAIAKASLVPWSVRKDVPQVAVCVGRADLNAPHTMADIVNLDDRAGEMG